MLIQNPSAFMCLQNPPCRIHYRFFEKCKRNGQTPPTACDGWKCTEFVCLSLSAHLSGCHLSTSQSPPQGPFSTLSVTMVSTAARCFFASSALGPGALSDSVNALQSQWLLPIKVWLKRAKAVVLSQPGMKNHRGIKKDRRDGEKSDRDTRGRHNCCVKCRLNLRSQDISQTIISDEQASSGYEVSCK